MSTKVQRQLQPTIPNARRSRSTAFEERVRARPLLLAVPLYRRADLARQVIASILACSQEIIGLRGEVILYNDSPDDPALEKAVADTIGSADSRLSIRTERNPQNLGFVQTTNRAIAEAVRLGYDIVLLNSDTILTPGALSEMAQIAVADPMIGFVNPRSNNATLATLPYQEGFRHLPVEEARTAWRTISMRLPPFSYVPTANGFCILIRWIVLAEFGGFDEIYGRGYNEENDLIMRAGRRGYRAVLANRAFVWHQGSASFDLANEHAKLEGSNREVLLRRYPEYLRLTAAYFSSAEQRAEFLLGALIPDEAGKLDVALDMSSFVAAHNGTFTAGLQLLGAAAVEWAPRFNVYVLCAEDTYAFHDMARFGVERRDPHGPEAYAAIFRVGQPYDWGAVERLALKGASFGVFMLDTISQDCSQLSDPEIHKLWSWTMEHADFIAATSLLTCEQLQRRFKFGPGVKMLRSLHSLDLADYLLPPPGPEDEIAPPGFVFVVGNHYWHKDVVQTVNALSEADAARRIVVLGGDDQPFAPVDGGVHAPAGLNLAPNVTRVKAGALTPGQISALYAGATAVVVPSHYEGFGMPVLNALALRRPVFVRALPVFAELWDRLDGDDNIHPYVTTTELVESLAEPPMWDDPGASSGHPGDAARAARDIGRGLDEAIRDASYERMVSRIRTLPGRQGRTNLPPETAPAFVARTAAQKFERWLLALLRVPGVFAILRSGVHAARRMAGNRRREI